jgi:anti-sigma-K factor RskA
MRMQTQDACVSWIVSLVEASDPNAVRLSLAEANAYLASFGDPTGTPARRADLIAELRERLPKDQAGRRSDRSHRQWNRRRVMWRRFVPSRGVIANGA